MEETLTLRFTKHEHIPQAGDEVTMKGMVGTVYLVKIHRVISQQNQGDGHVALKVKATRQIIEPTQ